MRWIAVHCYQCAAYTNGASGGTSGGTAYRLLVGETQRVLFYLSLWCVLHFLWPLLAALGGAGLALGSAGLCG
jgi:hypothetical protein